MSGPAVPAVSVLMPVRDGEPFLADALASICGQSLTDIELILVDDASVDGSRERMEAAAATDGRIRVLDSPGSGIVAALEAARAAARAPYLARMDADDVVPPQRLAEQLEYMESHSDIALCGGRVEFFPREGLKDGTLRYERWINATMTPAAIERDLFVECPLPHPTFFARAAAVADIGGYREAGWPEDYDLLLRLWEAGGRFGKVGGAPTRWRDHPARLSRSDRRYRIDAFRRLKVDVVVRRFLRLGDGVLPAVVWGAGPTGKAFQKLLLAEGVEVAALVDLDPRKIGQEIHGARVVAPDRLDRYDGIFCLGAVSGSEARADIRMALSRAGRTELKDFVMVA